jgi:hypothetical protein
MSHNDSRDDPRPSTSDRLPHKPTKEGSIGAGSSPERSGQGSLAGGSDRLGTERKEVGDARSSARDRPHVTENEDGAPVQESRSGRGDAPVLPANASGQDAVPVDQQDEPIDDESMYDRRPQRAGIRRLSHPND